MIAKKIALRLAQMAGRKNSPSLEQARVILLKQYPEEKEEVIDDFLWHYSEHLYDLSQFEQFHLDNERFEKEVPKMSRTEPVPISINSLDPGIRNLVQQLWDAGVRTYESGEAQIRVPADEKPSMAEIRNQDAAGRYYLNGRNVSEKAFLIIHKEDLEKAKPFLPGDIYVEEGTGGYGPSEYGPVPGDDEMVYITFK